MLSFQVGHLYGRRMLQGVVEAKGIKVCEGRVAESLQRVAPVQYEHRWNDTMVRFNPSPYTALHFGYKLHIDQNEKLRMYGVVQRWIFRNDCQLCHYATVLPFVTVFSGGLSVQELLYSHYNTCISLFWLIIHTCTQTSSGNLWFVAPAACWPWKGIQSDTIHPRTA